MLHMASCLYIHSSIKFIYHLDSFNDWVKKNPTTKECSEIWELWESKGMREVPDENKFKEEVNSSWDNQYDWFLKSAQLECQIGQ